EGGDLTAEIDEGYAHYRTRVVPGLLPLFGSVLAASARLAGRLPGRWASVAGAAAKAPALALVPAEIAEASPAPIEASATAAAVDDPEVTAARRLARVIISDIE